jgi:TRAP-type C4-dicarboxylate transport system substrate-binding protein
MNMQKTSQRTALIASLLVAALAAVGCATVPADRGGAVGQAPRVTLTLANGNGDHAELQPFADAVARLSDDSLHIDFRDNATNVVEAVKAGTDDLGWNGPANWHQLGVTSFDALAAPFLIDSYPLEARVLEAPIATSALAGLDAIGLVGIGIQPGPLKLLSAAHHALLAPADFVGLTVAIGPSTITADALKALGATAVPVPADASLAGVDAVEAQLQAIIGNHFQGAMTHTGVNVSLLSRPVVYFANPKKFRALSEAQQEALRLAVVQASAAALGNLIQVEDAAFAALCANGSDMVSATPADLAALRVAVQPVYDELRRDPTTAAAIDSMETIKAALPPSAPSRSCPIGSAPSASIDASPKPTVAPSAVSAGFPEGTYTSTISAAQMVDSWKRYSIPPDSQLQCPCTGGFTLRNGIMMGGENDRWYYSFFGDHVTIGVQGSANGAFTVRWTFDGRRLTFSDMVGGDAGDRGVFETVPFTWTK